MDKKTINKKIIKPLSSDVSLIESYNENDILFNLNLVSSYNDEEITKSGRDYPITVTKKLAGFEVKIVMNVDLSMHFTVKDGEDKIILDQLV